MTEPPSSARNCFVPSLRKNHPGVISEKLKPALFLFPRDGTICGGKNASLFTKFILTEGEKQK